MQDLKKWNRIVMTPRGLPFSGVGGLGGGGGGHLFGIHVHVWHYVSFNQVRSELFSATR